MNYNYYAIYHSSKGYWDVCPWSGVGWTQDINKATRFRSDILDALPWKEDSRVSFVKID